MRGDCDYRYQRMGRFIKRASEEEECTQGRLQLLGRLGGGALSTKILEGGKEQSRREVQCDSGDGDLGETS